MKNTTQHWLRSASALVAAGTLVFGMTGCNGCGSSAPAPITNAANGPDPADANLATANSGQPTQVMGQSQSYTPQQSSESYPAGQQAPAPIVNGNGSYNESQNYNTQPNGYYDNGQQNYQQGYDNSPDAYAYAQTDQAPPELPVYDQPPAPDDNDLWTPGYWGYANTGYYWVPGAWVSAPYIGALWTPGWWGFGGGHYRWNHGYWGRHIGYYGGINYGYGYVGSGYYGGYWNSDHFYYNRAVTRVSPRVTNVYERNVVVNNVRYTSETNNRVSYNGGRGGVNYQPRPYEVAAMHEQHVGPLPAQQQFHREAATNRANFYADNHGRPAQVALAQPIRTERITAPAEINRGGFGRGAATPNVAMPNAAALSERNEQQRMQAAQGRTIQEQQQHNAVEQQRNQQLQTGIQAQQRNQLERQRGALEQQRNPQAQPNAVLQQRNQLEQQHSQQMQQRMQGMEQGPRGVQEARPAPQQQQRFEQQPRPQQQQQQRFEQQARPQPAPQQRIEQARPQPMQQQHFEQRAAPVPQPQQHIEAPRAAPMPHVEAPRSAPAPAPHAEAPRGAPAGGGEHAGGGGHH